MSESPDPTRTTSMAGSYDASEAMSHETTILVENLEFAYGKKSALFDINLKIPKGLITAFIGPSGCGKSTLLRCFNRMNDLIEGTRITQGGVKIAGVDIYSRKWM